MPGTWGWLCHRACLTFPPQSRFAERGTYQVREFVSREPHQKVEMSPTRVLQRASLKTKLNIETCLGWSRWYLQSCLRGRAIFPVCITEISPARPPVSASLSNRDTLGISIYDHLTPKRSLQTISCGQVSGLVAGLLARRLMMQH